MLACCYSNALLGSCSKTGEKTSDTVKNQYAATCMVCFNHPIYKCVMVKYDSHFPQQQKKNDSHYSKISTIQIPYANIH